MKPYGFPHSRKPRRDWFGTILATVIFVILGVVIWLVLSSCTVQRLLVRPEPSDLTPQERNLVILNGWIYNPPLTFGAWNVSTVRFEYTLSERVRLMTLPVKVLSTIPFVVVVDSAGKIHAMNDVGVKLRIGEDLR